MPYIPLLRQPGPIQNAPAPVLDRQQRPTPDNRALSQAVGNLGQAGQIKDVNSRIFTAPIEALGAVGEAVSKAGDIMGALALKRREAETDAQVMQADTSLRVALEEHNAWREQNSDQTTWAKHFEDTMGQARQAIDSNDKLHPAARQKIKMNADRFTALARVGLEGDANKQAFAMAKSEAVARSRYLEEGKQYDEASAGDEEAVKKGYLWPHEKAAADAQRLRFKEADAQDAKKAEQEAIYTNKLTAIQADPFNAKVEDVPDPILKDRLETQRRQQIRMMKNDKTDLVANGIASGAIKSEQDVKALDGPDFPPAEQAHWIDVLKRGANEAEQEKARAEAPAKSAALEAEVRAWDAESDPDGEKLRAFTLRKMELPVGYREDIDNVLDRKRKQLEPEPDKEVHEMVMDSLSESLRSGQFNKELPPEKPADDAPEDKKLKWRQEMGIYNQRAARVMYGIKQAWKKEQKVNPKMTMEQAIGFLARMNAQPITNAEPPSLFPAEMIKDDWQTRVAPYAFGAEGDLPTSGKKQPSLIDSPPP